jgi:hypothetical protein
MDRTSSAETFDLHRLQLPASRAHRERIGVQRG